MAFYIAAVIVTLMQFLRVRDRRLLPLLALFTCLAVAHQRGEWDPWGRTFHYGAGLSGLALLLLLLPRATHGHEGTPKK